ncbi:MAG: hypothetical protein EBU40_07890 [Proteobacteria bacterium]|nr:hypothetical protein [Pseudomonadota bacterium]
MRVIAKPVVSGGTNEMVATRPAIEKTESSSSPVSQDDGAPGAERVGAPPTNLPVATDPVSSSESLKIEGIGSEKSGGSVPPFVALMYSSSSRPSASSSDAEASTRSETLARHRTLRSARLATDREVLHPAWFDALPASLDDLRTDEGAASDASPMGKGLRETPISRAPRSRLEPRPQRPRLALPGSAWPWWGWAVYTSTIGVVVFAALYFAALARLLLPRTQRFWAFRTRQAAAEYLLSVTAACLFATGIWVVTLPSFGHEIDFALAAPTVELTPTLTPDVGAVVTDPSMTVMTTVEANANATESDLSLDSVAEVMSLSSSGAVPNAVGTVADLVTTGTPLTETSPISDQVVEPAPPVARTPSSVSPAPVAVNGMARVVVANTGGRGVAFRNSPQWDDRTVPKVAFREGTSLTIVTSGIVGDDGSGGKVSWLMVRDSVGRTGYVPAQFTTAR